MCLFEHVIVAQRMPCKAGKLKYNENICVRRILAAADEDIAGSAIDAILDRGILLSLLHGQRLPTAFPCGGGLSCPAVLRRHRGGSKAVDAVLQFSG